MADFIDISGFQFGLLKTIRLHCGGHGLRLEWECVCDCGNTCIVVGDKLKRGHTSSCGCLKYKGRGVIDIVGQKFNLLTVIERDLSTKRKIYWKCVCECGREKYVLGSNLKNGSVKSCGCLGKYNNVTHGLKWTRLYAIFDNMKGRCYRKNNPNFNRYGARGIKICNEWLNDFKVFHNWAMTHGYQENLTIERLDNSKNYEPSNCTWIPLEEQARNREISLGVEKVIDIKKRLANKETCLSISKYYNVHPTTISNIKRNKSYRYISTM